MATLPHEGDYPVIYGQLAVSVGSGYRHGYLARPDQAGRFPVVILVPDLDGITAHEKYLARRIARHGVAVLAVELYRNAVADRDQGLAAYHAMPDNEALFVLDEAHHYLSSEDITWAHADRVGMLGLDVGGRFSIITAAHRPWVAASAVAYTPLTGDEERQHPVAEMLNHLGAPLLGLYGSQDDLIDTDTVDEAQARNASGQWLLYDGAAHGFLDETGPTFDAAAFEDAVLRLSGFFTTHLPKAVEYELG